MRQTIERAAAQATHSESRRKLVWAAGLIALAAAMAGLGWWLGRGGGTVSPAEYQQITFRTGFMGNARFTPDGSVVYSATWDGGENQLYLARLGESGSRELGLKDAELLGISKGGLFRSYKKDGPGKYKLCAHVGSGQIDLE